MAVLADFGDEDARRPSVGFAEGRDRAARLFEPAAFARRGVDALDRADFGGVPAPGFFQRQGYFADRRLGARRIDGAGEEIAFAAFRQMRELGECCLAGVFIALGPQARELFDLAGAHRRIVDFQYVDLCIRAVNIFVDADDGLLA